MSGAYGARNAARSGAALAALALLGGCAALVPGEQRPVSCHRATETELATIGRVLVLPFRSDEGVPADVERIRQSVVREVLELDRFELVPLPTRADEGAAILDAVRRGRLATREVAELIGRYRVDGLLIGTVTAARPYTPPHLGLRIELVSLHDASLVWRVDAIFDGADAAIEADARHYAATVQAEDTSLHGWRMTLLSPQRFTDYVAHRVVATLRR